MKKQRTKRHEPKGVYITVGVAGHVDHGKTSLVKCLTGIDTDRLQEEKRRNLSIESGVAPMRVNQDFQIALIDVPGHTDFLKNTIRGLSCVDMAILVVAADDGVMPQTLEHLEILKFLQVKTGFTVLSKADLVDDETLELAELELSEVISGTFLDGKPIVPFSAIDRRGLGKIRIILEKEVMNVACKNVEAPFRLCVDRVKSFAGFGTVATGTILSGVIHERDIVQILPSLRAISSPSRRLSELEASDEVRARFLEVHHHRVSQAFAGQRVGINLPRTTLEQVKRGTVLAQPDTIDVSYLLNGELSMLQKGWKHLKDRQRVRLYLGTSVANAMVVLIGRERLNPGEKCLVQLRVLEPVASQAGDPFVICSLNPRTIIGGGIILEVSRRKYREAKCRDIIQYLNAIQRKDISAAVSHLLKQERNRLMTPNKIARKIGFPYEEVQKELQSRVKTKELLDFGDQNFFGNDSYQGLKTRIPKVVKKIFAENPYRNAVTAEEIKAGLERDLDDIPFKRMLLELCTEGKLAKKDKGFEYPGPSRFSRQQEELVKFMLNFAQTSALVPFSVETAWNALNQTSMVGSKLPKATSPSRRPLRAGGPMHKNSASMLEQAGERIHRKALEKLLNYLCAQGELVRLNNGRFLSVQAMEEIKKRVIEVISSKGSLTLADSKKILGYGRTVGIPVLEYLDSLGVTLRQGNVRMLRK